jgi:diphthamide synthase (EF-2-diphthine--ammonia ligase)
VEDLYLLLAYIKACMPHVTAVSSGAIASDYQRLRVENVCARLDLTSLAYMWHMPQRQLLRWEQTGLGVTVFVGSGVACYMWHMPQRQLLRWEQTCINATVFAESDVTCYVWHMPQQLLRWEQTGETVLRPVCGLSQLCRSSNEFRWVSCVRFGQVLS